MKAYIKGLNICAPRRQNLLHYKNFLAKNGHKLVYDPGNCDVILVWTCGFRKDVIENSIRELNRYEKEYSGDIIALGCLPDIDRKLLKNEFKGTIVPWKEEGKFFEKYFYAAAGSFNISAPVFYENAVCRDAAEHRRLQPDSDIIFADQFFKLLISYGCPYECSYCTEKLAFPPYKSFAEDELIEACRIPIEKQGQNHIILIGDCIGEYGRDIGSSFPCLIRRLHFKYPQAVYALQNFHPKNFLDFFDDMKEFLENNWIVHLNLPVQSASNKVLSEMKRQYTKEDLDKVFGLLAKLKFKKFDTHIIVGFPGETDSDFMQTIDFLRMYRPTYALVSKYYDPAPALSFKMENKVDNDMINRRLGIIENEMRKIGMIYNIDGGNFMEDRFRRINTKVESV